MTTFALPPSAQFLSGDRKIETLKDKQHLKVRGVGALGRVQVIDGARWEVQVDIPLDGAR